jgi:hypothetical protein
MATPANYTFGHCPTIKSRRRKVKFRKEENAMYNMSPDVYRELYRRRCLAVVPIPAEDLQNRIHRIFHRKNSGNSRETSIVS